jgi:DAACS family dicarboxylate/amino acid:cation (Na+ or H+) symporter
MVVVPMVFSGLVIGVNQLGQHHGLGKVVRQTLIFTVLASTASVLIGVGLVSALQPGKYFNVQIIEPQDTTTQIQKIENNADSAKPITQSILEIIPKNPLESAIKAFDGEMLSLMFFALILGYALSQISKSQKESAFLKILEDIYEACLYIVSLAMKLAPAAVFCLVFSSSLKFGYQILLSLAAYAGVVLLGLLIQNFGVYSILLKTFAKRSPQKFFKDVREVLVYAFATASSNASLP